MAESVTNLPEKMPVNQAVFLYDFSQTHIGTLGRVICKACQSEAMKMSYGDDRVFERICKELDAHYFIGEV